MYSAIDLRPESVIAELDGLRRKFEAAQRTLPKVPDVHFGATAREPIYRRDKMVVYRFANPREPGSVRPLLISYALVNRPYMVDLQDDRSLVKRLLGLGRDVYLIDWGYPDLADRALTLGDYILGYIEDAVHAVCEHTGHEQLDLLGICQGGAFSLCYAALRPQRVKNLITMVTPVDFHTRDNMLSHWTRELDIDLFVDTLGNVPADLMNWCYLTLKPHRLLHQKYVGLTDLLDNPAELENFLRMEKWIFDSPDQAGEAFRQFIRDFYQGNKLMRGEVEIDGERVDLGAVKQPVLNIYAQQDHLVPPDASRALKGVVGTKDYTEVAFPGGHIGIYVSSRAQREVPQAIHDWLSARS